MAIVAAVGGLAVPAGLMLNAGWRPTTKIVLTALLIAAVASLMLQLLLWSRGSKPLSRPALAGTVVLFACACLCNVVSYWSGAAYFALVALMGCLGLAIACAKLAPWAQRRRFGYVAG